MKDNQLLFILFPWIEHLNEEEVVEFRDELLALLEDWKATAEVNSSPKLSEVLSVGRQVYDKG